MLAAKPALASYQEPQYGESLLYFAVSTHRYMAARALLKGGVNPNAAFCFKDGNTPLIEAASFYGSSRFVRLLLTHGADPNLESRPPSVLRSTTPLIEAVISRTKSVELLVEKGADINHVTNKSYRSALQTALSGSQLEIARFLLIDKQADFRAIMGVNINNDTIYIATILRELAYRLDSREHQQKMEIVRYLETHGIDYRGEPVPERFSRKYPKEFIEAY